VLRNSAAYKFITPNPRYSIFGQKTNQETAIDL